MSLPRFYRIRRPGFTLIELLLVISIIAVLSALGLSIMGSAERDALETRTQAGIERISNVLNRKLEDFRYRILPVRMPPGADPETVRLLHKQALAELIRTEFPFRFHHVDVNNFPFPRNQLLPVSDPQLTFMFPQIANRYAATTIERLTEPPPPVPAPGTDPDDQAFDDYFGYYRFEDAEMLYAILALNFDEFGQPLSAVLREREIGDTDNDGLFEVLDGFGDPLQFRVGGAEGQELLLNPNDFDPTQISTHPRYPYTQSASFDPVLGIEDYRISIRSVNVPTRGGSAVVTQ
ncbi:MAG: type II secretion system protein [Pirellulaceae bacterium]|nr:type II secretion system protein [Pirellulaceae bacterium]